MKIGVIKFLFYAGSRNVLAWKRNTDQYTPGPAHSCRLQQLQLDRSGLSYSSKISHESQNVVV